MPVSTAFLLGLILGYALRPIFKFIKDNPPF